MARSTFRSENVQSTPGLAPLLEVEMLKKCTPLWREAHFEVKMYKTHIRFRPLLEVEMSKKCTPLWREAHFQVKMYKTHHGFGPLLEVQMSKKCTLLCSAQAHCAKSSKVFKALRGSDHFWRSTTTSTFRVAGARDSNALHSITPK